jgi:two-component system, LytTR family, response regulator LytT
MGKKPGVLIKMSKTFDHDIDPLNFTSDYAATGEFAAFKRRFIIRSGNKYLFKDVKDIAYFFAEGKYVYLVTNDLGKYLIEYTLEKLEERLDNYLFFRVKRNLIVKIDSIKEFVTYRGGRLKLVLSPSPGEEIIISREKVLEFKRWVDA